MTDTDKPIRPNFSWYMERIGDPDAPWRPSPYEDKRDLRPPSWFGHAILSERNRWKGKPLSKVVAEWR